MKPIYFEKSLGLDIREESVALTLLGKSLKAIHPIASDFFAMPRLSPANEKSEKFFLDRINRFLMRTDVWPENVAISLPRNAYSFQSFELPAPDLKSVHSMVHFELERHFSSSIDGLYYGYHASKKKDNLFHIISAAIKKETADYYLELLNRLNLKPTLLDVPTFSNINLILAQNPEMPKLSAMVDVGSRGIDLSLLKNRRVEFSKNVSFDDPDFKRGLFEKNIEPDYYESISRGLTKIIVEELQIALESSRAIEGSESVEVIYLLGGGPYSSFLARQLQEETEVSTSKVQAVVGGKDKSAKKLSSSLLTTAFSLGLRAIKRNEIETNLLPQNLQPRKRKTNIKVTLGLSAAAVFLLAGLFINKITYNKVTLAKLEQQLQEVKGQAESLQRIDSEFDSLEQSMNTLNAIEQVYPSRLPVLVELSRVLPGNTWVTNLKVVKNNLEFSGYSETASQLVPIMEKSAYFNATGFTGTILRDKDGEKFTIHSDIQISR